MHRENCPANRVLFDLPRKIEKMEADSRNSQGIHRGPSHQICSHEKKIEVCLPFLGLGPSE